MLYSILVSSSLFGSVYLVSKSLEMINKMFLHGKKIPHKLFIINSSIFTVSSFIFGYTLYLIESKYEKIENKKYLNYYLPRYKI
jgi:hypothetical protein